MLGPKRFQEVEEPLPLTKIQYEIEAFKQRMILKTVKWALIVALLILAILIAPRL